MEQTNLVYDSIISGALRMARRHWWVVAVATVLGLLAGFVLSSGGAAYTGSTTVLFRLMNSGSTPLTSADDPQIDPVALASQLETTKLDLKLPDSSSVTLTGDDKASTIKVESEGSSKADVEAAIKVAVDQIRASAVAEASEPITTRITALENLVAENRSRVDAFDLQLQELDNSGGSTGVANPIVLARIDAANAANTAELNLSLAKQRLESVAKNLVSTTKYRIVPADSSIMAPAALAIVALAASLGVCFVLAGLDGRIRRRIQIERDVPHASFLGAIGSAPSDAEIALVAHATARLVDEVNAAEVVFVPLNSKVASDLGTRLSNAVTTDSTTVAVDDVSSSYSDNNLIVFLTPFGSVGLDVLQSLVADARTAGSRATATVLTNVPRADHAWAAVSIY